MIEEVKAVLKNQTWDLVERPKGWDVVGSFALWNKYSGTLEKRKARIVVKRFSQQPGRDFHETYAPRGTPKHDPTGYGNRSPQTYAYQTIRCEDRIPKRDLGRGSLHAESDEQDSTPYNRGRKIWLSPRQRRCWIVWQSATKSAEWRRRFTALNRPVALGTNASTRNFETSEWHRWRAIHVFTCITETATHW